MSFTGGQQTRDTSASTTKPYFCYQCDRTVTITICPSTDPFCPICHEGFLEEFENPNPNPDPNVDPFLPFQPDPFSSLLPLLFSDPFQNQTRTAPSPEPTAFNPVDFLRNHLQNLHTDGARIQLVIENHPGGFEFGSRLPSNFGDYFIGPGLEQLIQQLAENDPNRYGTPPASKKAVDALPTVKIHEGMLISEMNQCAVCKDEFEKGEEAKQMPCKHVYHNDCLVPWLELHSSCPVCRYELPTDDAEYESRRGGGGDGDGTGAAAAGRAGGENQTVERRFSISLPWLFGGGRQDGSSGGGSS